MKKTMTVGVAVIAATVLASAKLNKLDKTAKFSFIRTLSRLRPIREKNEADEKDAQERLKPDNWDEILAIEERPRNEWTPAETALHDTAVIKFNKAVEECMNSLRDETVDVDVEEVGEDALSLLFDSNPEWTAAGMERMVELFTK